MVSDRMLTGNLAAPWKPVRNAMSILWIDQLQRAASDATFAALLNEFADGLKASAPQKMAVDWSSVIKLVLWVIEYINSHPLGG